MPEFTTLRSSSSAVMINKDAIGTIHFNKENQTCRVTMLSGLEVTLNVDKTEQLIIAMFGERTYNILLGKEEGDVNESED